MIQLFGPSRIISTDEVLTVFRESAVDLIDGKPVKLGLSEFKVKANVQPLNGRDLLLVPEGDRFKDQFWVYTNEQIKPLKVNDRITRGDFNFQVQSLETWGRAPYGYQRARIMRIDVGPYATLGDSG